MKRFEYRVLELKADGFWSSRVDNQMLLSGLNELGRDGWEVVSGFDSAPTEGIKRPMLLLKREIPAQ